MFSPVREAKVDSRPEGEKHDPYNLVGFANLGKTNNHLMQLESAQYYSITSKDHG